MSPFRIGKKNSAETRIPILLLAILKTRQPHDSGRVMDGDVAADGGDQLSLQSCELGKIRNGLGQTPIGVDAAAAVNKQCREGQVRRNNSLTGFRFGAVPVE